MNGTWAFIEWDGLHFSWILNDFIDLYDFHYLSEVFQCRFNAM
jgi:hypothetical protein